MSDLHALIRAKIQRELDSGKTQMEIAKQCGVPEEQIVVGEIAVGYRAELIGTIRGWEASAMVGRRTAPGEAAKAPEPPSWLPR